MHLTKVTLPSSVVTDLHVGDLLKNDDREGRVFGRITHIKSKGIWKEMLIDTEDKTDDGRDPTPRRDRKVPAGQDQ